MDKQWRETVQKGVALLQEQKHYTQVSIVKKCATLGHQFGNASLSNCLKNDRPVGSKSLRLMAAGIAKLVEMELSLVYDKSTGAFAATGQAMPPPVVVVEQKQDKWQGMVISNSRLPIDQKIAFMATARKEVVEVGIRLHTFSRGFLSLSDQDYRDHIVKLLQRGVDFKGYVLDPHSTEAKQYFGDRAKVLKQEQNAVEEARQTLTQLKEITEELNAYGYTGKFSVYTYKHFPQNLFLGVDVQEPGGKLAVSHYIYGLRRAECPVWQFTRAEQPELFRKYATSLEYMRRDAVLAYGG